LIDGKAVLAILLFVLALNPVASMAGSNLNFAVKGGEGSAGECLLTALVFLQCGVFPSDDTFTDSLFPTKSMEESVQLLLIVQDTPTVPSGKNYAFLKFDLTKVLPLALIASHARPLNASLWLYADLTTAFNNASVRVYHVLSNDWHENTLTWNNMPPIDESHYEQNQIRGIDMWYRWNVTDDVSGDMQSGGVSSFALISGFKSWMNIAWFTSKEYQVYQKENVSKSPELDLYFREPTLTLVSSLPHLLMTIDGSKVQADENGSLQMAVPWGTHEITVPESVPKREGEREFFAGWDDNVSTPSREIVVGHDQTFRVSYRTQYQLSVNSLFGTASGSGWYFAEETARASVQPTWVFSEGFMGALGVRHVLDHWEGACQSSTLPECVITMDEPKQVVAIWRNDYTVPIAILALVGLAAATAVAWRKLRK